MPHKLASSALGVLIVLCIALAWSGAMPRFVSGRPHDEETGLNHEANIDEANDSRVEAHSSDDCDDDHDECDADDDQDDEADDGEGDDAHRDSAEDDDDSAMPDSDDETDTHVDDEGGEPGNDEDANSEDDEVDLDEARTDDSDDDHESAPRGVAASEGALGSPSQGGGFFGGFGGDGMLPASAMPSKRFVQGMHCIVSWSEKNDTVWGYSDKLGKWTRKKIPQQKKLLPTVGSYVAVFLGDDRLYAYSSTTGRWGELKTTALPTVGQEKILVETDDKVYIFADSSGRWTSPNDSLESDDEGTAEDVGNRRPGGRRGSPNYGRGSLFGGMNPLEIVTGPRNELPPLLNANGQPLELVDGDGELMVIDPEIRDRTAARDLLASFKAQSDQAEKRAVSAADSLRQARARQGNDTPAVHELQHQLQKLVSDAFDRRQQTQRLEAEILRMRMRQVDQRMIDRHRLKQNIVDHRVQELIDGNLQWDADKASGKSRPPQGPTRPVKP